VLQCVAVCCSVLQCVAVCCSVLQRVAVCCSVLQCVAVCCSVPYTAQCTCVDITHEVIRDMSHVPQHTRPMTRPCSVLQCVHCSVLQCVRCSVLQCVCCSELLCAAVNIFSPQHTGMAHCET